MRINISQNAGNYRRFETIKFQYAQDPYTIVKVKKTLTSYTITVKKVSWSKWRLINWFIKLFYRIRYM